MPTIDELYQALEEGRLPEDEGMALPQQQASPMEAQMPTEVVPPVEEAPSETVSVDNLIPGETTGPVKSEGMLGPIAQERAPGMDLLDSMAFRQATAARKYTPDEVADYIKRIAPNLETGVENGQAWYGTKDKRFAVDPDSWGDIAEVADWLPAVAHVATQVPAQMVPGGIFTRGGVGGAVGGATQALENALANRTLGPEPQTVEDYKNIGMEVAANAIGAGAAPYADAALKGGLEFAKAAGPELTRGIGKAGSFTAKTLGKGVEKLFQATTTFKPEQIFKILTPKLSVVTGWKEREPVVRNGVKWLHAHLPESLSGWDVDEISTNVSNVADRSKNWIGQLYFDLDKKGLAPRIKWSEAKPYFRELEYLASGENPTESDLVKAKARSALGYLKEQWDEAGIPADPLSGKKAVEGSLGVGRLWGNKVAINDMVERDAATGAAKGAATTVNAKIGEAYANLLEAKIDDTHVLKAMKLSPELSEFGATVKKVSQSTGESLLKSVNKIFHFTNALDPVANRAEGANFIKENVTSGGMLRNMAFMRPFGVGAGAGYISGLPVIGQVAGGLVAANQIRKSAPFILAKRAAELGELTPQVQQMLEAPARYLVEKGVQPSKAIEGVADLLLSNPNARNYATRGGMRTVTDYLQEYLDAPEAKAQQMLDELEKTSPESFKPEPNRIPPEQKGAYDTRLMESVLNKKIGAVEGYKAHQKIVKDGIIANGNW